MAALTEMNQEPVQPRVRHRRSERRATEEAAAQAAAQTLQTPAEPQDASRVQRPVPEPVQYANPPEAGGVYGYESYRPQARPAPQMQQEPREAPQPSAPQGFGYQQGGWYAQGQGAQGYPPAWPRQEQGFQGAPASQGAGGYAALQGESSSNTRQNTTGDPWGWSAGYRPVGTQRNGQETHRQDDAPAEKPRFRGGMAVKILLILVAAAALVFAGYSGWRGYQAVQTRRAMEAEVNAYNDRFCRGVYVDGIDLGGMTRAEAEDAVNAHQQASAGAWSVGLTWEGETLREIRSEDLGVTVDVEDALNQAWSRGHTGDLEARYADMRSLAEEPYEGSSIRPDTAKIDGILALVAQELYRVPEDAEMTGFNPDATDPFSFKPEVAGRMLDTEPLKAELYRRFENMESGEIPLAPEEIQPQVTVASLRSDMYSLRGYATTPISPTKSTEDRNKNIRRAFELVSGTVIQPGQQFSFNNIVGQRTVENGFFPAEEYVSGLHEEGIGGGVCQASTTIYQAAARANLQIDKRTPHSMAVNYTDYGKDATVYWWVGKGGQKIDFAFTNNTEHPIYIKAAVQSAERNRKRLQCNVWIYGESLGDGVSYEIVTEEITVPAPEEPETRRDKDMKYVTYKDETYEFQKAENGTEVHRWLVKYVNKKEVERKELETDMYPAKQQIIYVGIRERPEK